MFKESKKKSMRRNKKNSHISPEEALQFLEDIHEMMNDRDEPTVAISLRVPGNVLRAVKSKAKSDGKKYQSLIVEYIRNGLKRKS